MACEVKWELIMPDGELFDLSTPGLRVGTSSDSLGFDGAGLPPIRHISSRLYNQPGDILRSIEIDARVITITLTTWATDGTRLGLHSARAALLDHLRWNRGESIEPLILRYTLNGVSRDLRVHYGGDVEKPVGREGRTGIVGVRLIAHDPFWYAADESWVALAPSVIAGTASIICAYHKGEWNFYGAPVPALPAADYVNCAAIDPQTGDLYIAGGFLNFGGDALQDNIAMYDVSAGAWTDVGGGLNNEVHCMYFGPDGRLYVGGEFSDAGGVAAADSLAVWDRIAWSDLGGGGISFGGTVRCLCWLPNGDIYVGGIFTNWGGADGDNFTMYDYGADTYVDQVAGASAAVQAMAYDAVNGILYLGGLFTNWGDANGDYITTWDGAALSSIGTGLNGEVKDMQWGPDGKLYLCGNFTNAGGDADADYVAALDTGTDTFSAVGIYAGFFDAAQYHLAWDGDGRLWVGGDNVTFDKALVLINDQWTYTTITRVAGWGTVTGVNYDPGTETILLGATGRYTDMVHASTTDVTNAGNSKAWPIIKVYNQGTLMSIRNGISGDEIRFGLYSTGYVLVVQDGEIVTIDLTPGVKTLTSDWRGNLIPFLFPGLDLARLGLEPAPYAPGGVNPISVAMYQAGPREFGDGGAQLASWADMTGVSSANSDDGYLFVNIVDDGGGQFHVDIYSDAAKTEMVAHTAGYLVIGDKAIIADNDSGLGGTIEVTAVGPADTNIRVIYTLVEITWHDTYLDLDNAVYLPLVIAT